MASYKAEGRLHKIFDTEQKGATFQVRQFVIEVPDDKFPQMISFQLTQDRCTLIDDYTEGDQILVDFDLRGREWNERFFTNLNAWRIERADGAEAVPPAFDENVPLPTSVPDFDDDIPF